MEITKKTIEQLVRKYPNDFDLGGAVRDLIINRNINEVQKDPQQTDLINLINEIQSKDGN
jgi:hypothetical protein